ncbi:MAG: hypothetical protein HN952_06260 [Candidatus Cloacimonetes bacterium]|jgi:hypothetical protein|nr:hypothetical protein [Bacteroidota bacterium]MBT6994543.1 hypothetical protein [Candidatus Cloacimonadota bacterium]
MNVVELEKLQAKWGDDLNRRFDVAKRLDYYHNNQTHYLKKAIKKAYPKTAEEMLDKYEYTYPLTKRILDDISILFQTPLKLTIDNENLEKKFNEIINDTKFNSIMVKVNLLVNLTDKVGIIPVWRDGLELDIITADNCFVLQDPENPTKIKELFYQIGILENSPTKAETVATYVRWTNETQSIVDVDDTGGNIQNERDIVPNRFGIIPVVWFENDITTNTFWHNKTNHIIETNEIVNCELTNFRYMMAFQAFSTLVTVGIDETASIPFGASYNLKLPFDPAETKTPDAKYITPNPKLKEVWEVINNIILGAAQSVGISADSYLKVNSSFNSGYQLKLSKQDIINRTMGERPFYRPKIKDLINLMLELYTQNSDKNFTNAQITVDFGELTFDANPKEKQELRAMELANGTKNEIDFIIEDNPDLTRDEAIEHYKKLQDEKKQYQIGAGLIDAIK